MGGGLDIGRAQFFNETEDGIFASFKISKSSRGTDALIEASEELRTGLSVGVMVNAAKPKNGVLYVSSADLLEVSLVQAAAFKSAAVTDIAASEDEAAEPTLPTESETVVEETTAVEATPTVEAAAHRQRGQDADRGSRRRYVCARNLVVAASACDNVFVRRLGRATACELRNLLVSHCQSLSGLNGFVAVCQHATAIDNFTSFGVGVQRIHQHIAA